jgi:nicotinate-nucleotide adenylyltransferase
VASFALALADVDRLLVVPCYSHAWAKELLPFAHRLAMCRLAFADLRRLEVSELERELEGVSYTIRTLREVLRRWPGAELSLIVGADVWRDRHGWRDFEEITSLARVVVCQRAGLADQEGQLPQPPEVSASALRERLRQGASLTGLVPRSVARYIQEQGLYRDAGS